MHNPTLERGQLRRGFGTRTSSDSSEEFQELWRTTAKGDWIEELTVVQMEPREVRITQAHGTGQDHVKGRLQVSRRARDDPEDLAGGGLLLAGLREVAVAGLELLEEAGVLDGNGGL